MHDDTAARGHPSGRLLLSRRHAATLGLRHARRHDDTTTRRHDFIHLPLHCHTFSCRAAAATRCLRRGTTARPHTSEMPLLSRYHAVSVRLRHARPHDDTTARLLPLPAELDTVPMPLARRSFDTARRLKDTTTRLFVSAELEDPLRSLSAVHAATLLLCRRRVGRRGSERRRRSAEPSDLVAHNRRCAVVSLRRRASRQRLTSRRSAPRTEPAVPKASRCHHAGASSCVASATDVPSSPLRTENPVPGERRGTVVSPTAPLA